jgi:hypothetical protein
MDPQRVPESVSTAAVDQNLHRHRSPIGSHRLRESPAPVTLKLTGPVERTATTLETFAPRFREVFAVTLGEGAP